MARLNQITEWLAPKSGWKVQSDEYYAADFLIGARLITGEKPEDVGLVLGLAAEFRKMYETGVDHGQRSPQDMVAA